MAVALAIPEPLNRDLENKSLTWSERARTIKVRDSATYAQACDTLTAVKALRNEAEAHHRPVIDAAHKAHAAACDALRRIDNPLKEAEGILKSGIGTFELEQRRIQEQKAREDREQRERAMLEQREREIEDAEKEGASVEEIRAVADAPLQPVPVVRTQPTFTPQAGVSTAKTYRSVVMSIRKLAAAVAGGAVPETLVVANEKALNAMARALKGQMNIPGVRVEEIPVVRSKG